MTTQALRSSTCCSAGILSFMHAIARHCAAGYEWRGQNDLQHAIIAMYEAARPRLEAGIPDVQTLVSDNSERLNAALAERGWDIRLQPFGPPSIGGVSLFRRAMTWRQPGSRDTVQVGQKRYPAARVRHGWEAWTYRGERGLTVTECLRLYTSGDDVVWLLPYTGAQIADVALLNYAVGEIKKMQPHKPNEVAPADGRTNGCLFPMVDIRHTPDISFLNEMARWSPVMEKGFAETLADIVFGVILRDMVQQNVMQLDELGSLLDSGTAGQGYRSDTPTINGPFVAAYERNGMLDFAALCAEDSFRDPKSKNPLVLCDTVAKAPGTDQTPIVLAASKPASAPVTPHRPVPVPNGEKSFAIFV